MTPKRLPIPAYFKNTETGDLHTHCMVCQNSLEQMSTGYLIERVIRNVHSLNLEETLFEYAICLGCANQLRNELSESSRKKLEEFYAKNARTHERPAIEEDVMPLIENCLIEGRPVAESSEYALHAYCIGHEIVVSALPYAISDSAMDKMLPLISRETQDQLNRFKDEYFSGPPEFEEFLKSDRPVLI